MDRGYRFLESIHISVYTATLNNNYTTISNSSNIMAQYFTPSRLIMSSRDQDQRQLSTKEAFKLKLAVLDESAVYVFPNASSASTTSLPTSPSQTSEFSIPTELTLSAVDTDNSGHNYRPPFYNSPHSPTPELESQLIFPEFLYGGIETPNSSIIEADNAYSTSPVRHPTAAGTQETGATTGVNADDWRVRLAHYRQTLLPYFLRDSTTSQPPDDIKISLGQSSIPSPTQCHALDQRYPLPLLSFILSLLSIDESTEELLRSDYDPTKSALFPGQRLRVSGNDKDALEEDANGDKTRGDLYGLAKLLVEEKCNSQYTVRRAFWGTHSEDDFPTYPASLGNGFL